MRGRKESVKEKSWEGKKQYDLVLLGGGTGNYTLLSAFKHYPQFRLHAIVAMSDSGGSTGRLRDEYGVLPPGDVRQCLVALSEEEEAWRKVFTHRFTGGSLHGQNVGNILLSALEQTTGDFLRAVRLAASLLRAQGEVIPVTLQQAVLCAELMDGRIICGEHEIDRKEAPVKRVFFKQPVSATPLALKRILNADVLLIAPGDVYTSILPVLIVEGVREAFMHSPAQKILVTNIMNVPKHTEGWDVAAYVRAYEAVLKHDVFDLVIYNTRLPTRETLQAYAREGEEPVRVDPAAFKAWRQTHFLGADVLDEKPVRQEENDLVSRSLARHNAYKIASILLDYLAGR